MSWACAFTGLTSMFNDRQRIGLISSTPNPATAIDFMNVAVQQDLRTIFVEPGTEQAVAAAVAKACERKEVHPVDFKYIVALKSNDHMTDEYLEQKIKQSCALLNVAQLDLVLCPWPVAPSPNGMEDFDRKERNRQAVRMRKTWDKLCSLKSTLTMGERGVEPGKYIKNLGLLKVIGWQIEALCHPSPPNPEPRYMPVANYFAMSPWKSEMHKIRFCHSRGIQCLVRFIWDLKVQNGSGESEDETVKLLRKNHDGRSALQILSLWALNRGIVIFPDLEQIKDGIPKTAEEYDSWRVKASETLKEISILLNPLFRKKPMWKHAFALTEKEMELLDELDTGFNRKLNDKLMTKAPNAGKWKKKSELEAKEQQEDDEEGGDDNEAWEDEYKEFFEAQRKKQLEKDREDDDVQILRNVETKEKVLSATEKSQLQMQKQKRREEKVTVRSGLEYKPGEDQVVVTPKKLDIMKLSASSPRDEDEDEDEGGLPLVNDLRLEDDEVSDLEGEGDDDEDVEAEVGEVSLQDFLPSTIQSM
ncbi:hypothetical protein TrVE_jg13501 [Triparma verrucosa]|uniref:NADP-dependent oxidoreductase domain-containing protein n=1 Tax=Triparma verrucosa TaxID=1606542 RepID=A0A9W7EQH6_9STRA|nr:hypothetical protein TrVE_jg13501 [Triparma verrucosa]